MPHWCLVNHNDGTYVRAGKVFVPAIGGPEGWARLVEQDVLEQVTVVFSFRSTLQDPKPEVLWRRAYYRLGLLQKLCAGVPANVEPVEELDDRPRGASRFIHHDYECVGDLTAMPTDFVAPPYDQEKLISMGAMITLLGW